MATKAPTKPELTEHKFHITVMGRLLELLGGQMYKRRDLAIAELVANCWDAGAEVVDVSVPEPDDYDRASSQIVVTDDGCGMSADDVDNEYLVVGRNRRKEEGTDIAFGRPVMGRKGLGKLAGFGIAAHMQVTTWRDDRMSQLTLNAKDLKKHAGETQKVPVPGLVGPKDPSLPYPSGTQLILGDLKHVTAINVDRLRIALARRFSRIIRGKMMIRLNGLEVEDPKLDLESREPDQGLASAELSDGNEIQYYFAFSEKVIQEAELRGFTIYTRGKTAQAPPFFFRVEGTASGQHGTRYLTGVIEADYLDKGLDDESDIISTDRQEIDWEDAAAQPLLKWGEATTRKALRDWADRHGKQLEDWILQKPEFATRIQRLDEPARKQVSKFLRELGKGKPDRERVTEMADALIKAYEYQHFHDVIQDIHTASEDPVVLQTLLLHLSEWKVLESRTILEIIKGRLGIVDKFYKLLANDAPETAHRVGDENLHDLLATYPWLLHPEWQVLNEERQISTQLREWNEEDIKDEDSRLRYDFLALTDNARLVLVEIKRGSHPVELEELHRLEKYKQRLSGADNREIHMLLVYGGTLNVEKGLAQSWIERDDADLSHWNQLHQRVKNHYEHYRAVLEGEVEDPQFAQKPARGEHDS